VIEQYCFTSLAEMNAVLNGFNVAAERGSPDSEMFLNKGLIYSLIDSAGNQVGVPVKASTLYCQPTLRRLEELFELNREKRKIFKPDLKRRIDLVLGMPGRRSLDLAIRDFKGNGIELLFRRNAEGNIYGATYIDHINQTVFNGSDLGKDYAAKAILQRLENGNDPNDTNQAITNSQKRFGSIHPRNEFISAKANCEQDRSNVSSGNEMKWIAGLLHYSTPQDTTPLLPKKKRKKKKGLRI